MCKIVTHGLSEIKDIANENKGTIGKVKDDTFWIKIIFGSITFIVAIALAVQQFVHAMGHKTP